MCFSAAASFTTGIIISALGVAAFRKAKSKQKWFGAIPFIFGIQQIAEGFLWLALTKPEYSELSTLAMYTFLLFAQVVWPFWIPFSVFMIRKGNKYAMPLRALLALGIMISAYLAYCLLNYPVQAVVSEHHIAYLLKYPSRFREFGALIYLVVTVVPLWISGIPKMWLLGLLVLIAYFISYIFYEGYILSVWCFFAAALSAAIYIILRIQNRKTI